MRALLHALLLLSVAMLPLTSLAARAGTPADLTSSAFEIEQGPLSNTGQKTQPSLEHRHCSLWAAETAVRPLMTDSILLACAGHDLSLNATEPSSVGPEAATPPPKAWTRIFV